MSPPFRGKSGNGVTSTACTTFATAAPPISTASTGRVTWSAKAAMSSTGSITTPPGSRRSSTEGSSRAYACRAATTPRWGGPAALPRPSRNGRPAWGRLTRTSSFTSSSGTSPATPAIWYRRRTSPTTWSAPIRRSNLPTPTAPSGSCHPDRTVPRGGGSPSPTTRKRHSPSTCGPPTPIPNPIRLTTTTTTVCRSSIG